MLGNTAVELLEVAPGSLRVLSSPKVDDCVPPLIPLPAPWVAGVGAPRAQVKRQGEHSEHTQEPPAAEGRVLSYVTQLYQLS